MQRLLPLLCAAIACASCGLYTNVPAQVHIESVTAATIDFTIASATQSAVYKETQPTVTLVGEPGSIGVNYAEADVAYADVSGKEISSSDIAPMKLRQSVRVESSNYPGDPAAAQPIDQTQLGKQIFVGKTTVTLPVITRQVEDYGDKSANYANAGITAEVTLSGFDDAGFPQSLLIDVPITFTGPTGK